MEERRAGTVRHVGKRNVYITVANNREVGIAERVEPHKHRIVVFVLHKVSNHEAAA